MIITRLQGGLGNQLFQYAIGLKLSKINDTLLELDITEYKKNSNREYNLNSFNISGKILDPNIDLFLIDNNQNALVRLLLSVKPIVYKKKAIPYFKETSIKFDPNFFNFPNPCYLDGYWQSEKYFCDIRDLLLKEFSLINSLGENSTDLLNIIMRHNPVSIHIRRGDYVLNETTKKFHGLCSLSYYQKAIAIIKERIKDPFFFIFSDDPLWAQQNLILQDQAIFVTNTNPNSSYEDLYLMSQCSHHIIANSSFSWWGAWLANNRNQIVIAPTPWLNDKSGIENDIIPDRWISIPKN